MSQTATKSATYTDADVANVVTPVRADLMMIGDSSGCWSEDEARDYAHDIEQLAKAGYLKHVDVTLLDDGKEVRATRYVVSNDASGWSTSRPGGVLWPRVAKPYGRIVLRYNGNYTAAARAAMKSKLKIDWVTSTADTSHASLASAGGRAYASNAFGMEREDWAA